MLNFYSFWGGYKKTFLVDKKGLWVLNIVVHINSSLADSHFL
jgi:hypothetical protein